MESWQITLSIVFGYALVILVIGTGRWTRVGRVSMDDFFKVGPGFGFVILYLGMAGGFHTAFAIPGSMGFYHRHGVAFAGQVLWTVFAPLFMIYFVGARITCLGRKFNYITPADLIIDFFGEGKFRAFISLYTLSCCIPLMVANITGPARLLAGGTQGHMSYLGALLLMGALVIVYVTSSGLRGVTWTTVAQSVWMFVAIWAAAFWCLSLVDGGLMGLFTAVQNTNPELLTLPGPEGMATPQWWFSWPVFGIALYWAILPRAFMFFYSARDVKTVRRIGLTLGFYLMGLYLPAMVIGFTGALFYPELVGSGAEQSFPRLLAEYAPAWFAGVIIAGGLAAGMSSLDADVNANSAMLTKDVYKGFIRKEASDHHYVSVGRIFVVALVAITVAAASYDWGLVTIMIGVTAAMITQLLPALVTILVPGSRLRLTKVGVTVGIVVGLVVSLAVREQVYPLLGMNIPSFLPLFGIDPSFWGVAINFPVAWLVSRYTPLPDPEPVARIQAALREEFGRKPRRSIEPPRSAAQEG